MTNSNLRHLDFIRFSNEMKGLMVEMNTNPDVDTCKLTRQFLVAINLYSRQVSAHLDGQRWAKFHKVLVTTRRLIQGKPLPHDFKIVRLEALVAETLAAVTD